MPELLLLRHGKSDWSVEADDFHRPLKKRGQRGAQAIGFWLAQHQLTPDYILSSPATRALDTARICAANMNLDANEIHQDKRIYLASSEQLLAVLADCPRSAQCVMLVGHNPGFEDLLVYLAGTPAEIPAEGKLMPTATLARLQISTDWMKLKPGQARLIQLIRARDLDQYL